MDSTIICIEGSDGCGKQTHTTLIKEKLEALGKKVALISFPQYDNQSSTFVKSYLNGEYGDKAADIDPYQASCFFAMDRLVSYVNDWKKYINENDFIILDRYVGSNLIHQGCKFSNKKDIRSFVKWECDFEYERLKLPRPDITYFLDMPRWASKLLTKNRANKITNGSAQDIHERDETYMKKVEKVSKLICELQFWKVISCINPTVSSDSAGDLCDILSINDINDKLFGDIKKLYINGEEDGNF